MNLLKHYVFPLVIFASDFAFGQTAKDAMEIPYNCSGSNTAFQNQDVFTMVEEMPTYPGGITKLLGQITGQIKLSKSAQEELQTKIIVSFIVDTEGNVTNLCIEKPYYKDRLTNLENEILQSMARMEKWSPGKQSGRKVPVKFEMPVIVEMK